VQTRLRLGPGRVRRRVRRLGHQWRVAGVAAARVRLMVVEFLAGIRL